MNQAVARLPREKKRLRHPELITLDKKTAKPEGAIAVFPCLKTRTWNQKYDLNKSVIFNQEFFKLGRSTFLLHDIAMHFLKDNDPRLERTIPQNIRCANRYLKYPELFQKQWNGLWVIFLEEKVISKKGQSFMALRRASVLSDIEVWFFPDTQEVRNDFVIACLKEKIEE